MMQEVSEKEQSCPSRKNSKSKPFYKGRNRKTDPHKQVGFSCKESPRWFFYVRLLINVEGASLKT